MLAVALQIKLTAGIVVPAMALEILLSSQKGEKSRFKEVIRNLTVWGGSAAVVFLFLGLVLGSGYHQALISHFSAATAGAKEARQFDFSFRLLWQHTEAMWGAGAGLLLIVLRRDWRRMAFPVALLVTVAAIHSMHRPYWYYYYLHFAVPLAWLTGYAAGELFKLAWNRETKGWRTRAATTGGILGLSLLISTVGAYGGMRLWEEAGRIRDLPRVEDDAMIAKMKGMPGAPIGCTRGPRFIHFMPG